MQRMCITHPSQAKACFTWLRTSSLTAALQVRALWNFSRYLILTALPFKLVNDASQFVAPTFLSLLLGVVSSGQPSSLGYFYAVLMLCLLITGTLSDNQHFQRVMRAGAAPSSHLIRHVLLTFPSFSSTHFFFPPAQNRCCFGCGGSSASDAPGMSHCQRWCEASAGCSHAADTNVPSPAA